MADLSDIEVASVVKLVGSNSTGVEQTPVQSTANGALHSNLRGSDGLEISGLDDGNGGRAIQVAIAATGYDLSPANSTTVQLAAGATFTGVVESIVNQQSVSIILTSDQNGTLVCKEYIDAAGLRVSRSASYSILAGVPFSRSFAVNGNYYSNNFTNNGASTTTTLNLNIAYGTIPSATALGNSQVSLDEVNGTALSLGTKTSALSLPVVLSNNITYGASFTGAVTATAGTDVFTITGSATKTIEVLSIEVSGVQTTAGAIVIKALKRSTANTAGTSTTATGIPFDSASAAATAVVRAYTANPTLGTLVGDIKSIRKEIVTAGFANSDYESYKFDFTSLSGQGLILRGVNEVIALNLNATNLAGNSLNISITWTEV